MSFLRDQPLAQLPGAPGADGFVDLLVPLFDEVELVHDVHLGEVDDPLPLVIGADAVEAAIARTDMDAHAWERIPALVDHGAAPAPVPRGDRRTWGQELERRPLRQRRRRGRRRP